ncbi:hypothetical protein [Paraburkholderia solisilvae]|uniref:Uncharacterized protein n=1 Tax=Paraburkholderia solisilvae TaxID=624376 RepID=A0A6J5ENH7_9BURK|nr:hypothetical protein [Paraburkholderia solisilvae]CAB3766555.1 hypothetical protein LMG29739_04858 [Paraburkholderia solisilvae]
MCIQAIAKAMCGDFGGALHAEANAWGVGGSGAHAGGCAPRSGNGSFHASAACGESRGAHACASGSASHHGNRGGAFEQTTTRTSRGVDGSITQSTTTTRAHSGGENRYGDGRCFGHHAGHEHSIGRGDARGYSDHQSVSMHWSSDASGGGIGRSNGFAGGGSFAAASMSIAPAGPLAGLMNMFGGLLGSTGGQVA